MLSKWNICACGLLGLLMSLQTALGQNPIIHDQFTADPTARVWGDSIYLYPSHDILASKNRGQPGWFCMADYHGFVSADLVHWRDAGVITSQNAVPWVDSASYSMWAPDCVERNGKYYFYFPSKTAPGIMDSAGFTVGVAVADHPTGPFVPQRLPIKGVKGIDPNVLIDDDGQAYLYWAAGNIYGARLKSNMLELDGEIHVLKDLPVKGLKEGPFVFKRNGIYYLTYPHVADKTERLEYAVSNNPLGPFKPTGVIMEASPNCWTNHQSIVKFKGQWYLFYHFNAYSPRFDKARSVQIDSLFFNPDGTIRQVTPTLRGVGSTPATDTIQIDRYSQVSAGAAVQFLDKENTFAGWSVGLTAPQSWVRYNSVDFKSGAIKNLSVRVKAGGGGQLTVTADRLNGPVLCRLPLQKTADFSVILQKLQSKPKGVHDIFVTVTSDAATDSAAQIDWLRFE